VVGAGDWEVEAGGFAVVADGGAGADVTAGADVAAGVLAAGALAVGGGVDEVGELHAGIANKQISWITVTTNNRFMDFPSF